MTFNVFGGTFKPCSIYLCHKRVGPSTTLWHGTDVKMCAFAALLSAECGADEQFKCVPGRWIVPIGQTLFLLCGIILLINLLIATFK